MTTKTSLFFSSELTPGSPLWTFCEQRSWDLTACSLLGFKALPFTIKQPFDVVFISSPRAFNYFRSQITDSELIHYATIGTGTSKHLNKFHSSIVFTGEKSGDAASVALDFKEWLGEKRVLFPLSNRSHETVAAVIPDSQKEIVRCYATELLAMTLKPNDIYVFTSPSNVDAFLLKNKLSSSSMLVAWGKTTEKKLVDLGFSPTVVLEKSTEEYLVAELGKLFPSP